jgi:hypothetical protein
MAQTDSLATPDSTGLETDSLATPRAPAGEAGSPPAENAAERVRAIEKQRQTAMVQADIPTLAGIFAEGATYVHSNGLMQTRDELFRLLQSGDLHYLTFTVEDVRYRVHDGAVVGTGVQRINVKSSGKSLVLRSRYTVVYAGPGADLKLVAYQSTPVPEMAAKPAR